MSNSPPGPGGRRQEGDKRIFFVGRHDLRGPMLCALRNSGDAAYKTDPTNVVRLFAETPKRSRRRRPTAKDTAAVVEEMGLDPHIEMWNRPPRWGGSERADVVAFVRNRPCLRADRDEETAMRRSTVFGPRPVLSPLGLATMWWPARQY
jgi:hypothetical protein